MRDSEFFEGVSQQDLVVTGRRAKLPIFYYDIAYMMAVYPARYRALKRLMPDPRYIPARIAPGLGAVGITCFEHRDTDIGPYNEVAIAVFLHEPRHTLNLPGRAVAAALGRGHMHVYIHHLPVTTEIALVAGVDFYNYPKFIARIDFADAGEWRECRLAEEEQHILTFAGRRLPASRSERLRAFAHLYMNRQPQSAEFAMNSPRLGVGVRPGLTRLELGTRHPVALELAELLVGRQPLRYQYAPPGSEAILHGPDRLTLPLFRRIEEARLKLESVG